MGRRRAVDMYLNALRLGIYPPLFNSPSGDSWILSLRDENLMPINLFDANF